LPPQSVIKELRRALRQQNQRQKTAESTAFSGPACDLALQKRGGIYITKEYKFLNFPPQALRQALIHKRRKGGRR
jgi:hypothetical protein